SSRAPKAARELPSRADRRGARNPRAAGRARRACQRPRARLAHDLRGQAPGARRPGRRAARRTLLREGDDSGPRPRDRGPARAADRPATESQPRTAAGDGARDRPERPPAREEHASPAVLEGRRAPAHLSFAGGDMHDDVPTLTDGPEIAVVGMAGRFPGAENVDEFWRTLHGGMNGVSSFTDEEVKSALAGASLARDANY